MAYKQPRRTDLTSDLKFMARITYATMFVWTVLAFFGQMIKKKKEERKKERKFVPARVVASLQLKQGGRTTQWTIGALLFTRKMWLKR